MTQSVYDSVAVEYDSQTLQVPYFAHLNTRYKEILRENCPRLHLSPILDLGCGTGLYVEIICEGTTNYIGIDLSEEMLSKARLKSARIGRMASASFLRAEATFLPFKAETVSGLVSIGMVLPHLSSYEQGLTEISRVLRRGGVFLIEMDNKWSVDLAHYLVDALTAGKIFSYGFSGLQQISRYIQRDEYEWDARLDGLPADRKILLHKISISRLKQLLVSSGLLMENLYGVHVSTLFIPKEFPRDDDGLISSYVKLVEWLDTKLSRSYPFAYLGGSLIVVGKRVEERAGEC